MSRPGVPMSSQRGPHNIFWEPAGGRGGSKWNIRFWQLRKISVPNWICNKSLIKATQASSSADGPPEPDHGYWCCAQQRIQLMCFNIFTARILSKFDNGLWNWLMACGKNLKIGDSDFFCFLSSSYIYNICHSRKCKMFCFSTAIQLKWRASSWLLDQDN